MLVDRLRTILHQLYINNPNSPRQCTSAHVIYGCRLLTNPGVPRDRSQLTLRYRTYQHTKDVGVYGLPAEALFAIESHGWHDWAPES